MQFSHSLTVLNDREQIFVIMPIRTVPTGIHYIAGSIANSGALADKATGAMLISGDGNGGDKKNSDKSVEEILKGKKGSIKDAPKPSGSPSWDEVLNLTLSEVQKGAQQGLTGYKEIYKLLKDKRFNR